MVSREQHVRCSSMLWSKPYTKVWKKTIPDILVLVLARGVLHQSVSSVVVIVELVEHCLVDMMVQGHAPYCDIFNRALTWWIALHCYISLNIFYRCRSAFCI